MPIIPSKRIKNINDKTRKEVTMIVSTTSTIQGREIKKYLGVVIANEVLGTGPIADIKAAFIDGRGGRSGAYRKNLDELYNYVQQDCIKKAKQLGANAIIGFTVNINEVSGEGKQMFMATAMGTAAIIDEVKETTDSEHNLDSSNIVSGELIEKIIRKKAILKKLSYMLSSEDMNILLAAPDLRTAQRVLDIFISIDSVSSPNVFNRWESFIEEYLGSLDIENVSHLLYNQLEKKRKEKSVVNLISKFQLFQPTKILQLWKEGKLNREPFFELLKVNKERYSYSDLVAMKSINALFNTESKGAITIKKKLLTNYPAFICQDGHETPWEGELEDCFCQTCGKNTFGYMKSEQDSINELRNKIAILEEYFKE